MYAIRVTCDVYIQEEDTTCIKVDRSGSRLREKIQEYYVAQNSDTSTIGCYGISLSLDSTKGRISVHQTTYEARSHILIVQMWLKEVHGKNKYFVNAFVEPDRTVHIQPLEIELPPALQIQVEHRCNILYDRREEFVRKQRRWISGDYKRLAQAIDGKKPQEACQILLENGY